MHMCARRAAAWGRAPPPPAFPSKGPGGVVCRFLRHTRGRSRARGTPTPLGLRSDLGPCSGAALKAPDPKAGQPGTHTTAVCSNHSNQRRSLIRLRDNHRFIFFINFFCSDFQDLSTCVCLANPPSTPRPQPGRGCERCPHRTKSPWDQASP